MIKDLRADKLRLQLAHMEKAPPLMKKKEEMVEKFQPLKPDKKFEEDTNCPLPPMDNHPECMGKLKWLSQMWKSQPCYAGYGVNGSVCSFLIYLSEILVHPGVVTAESNTRIAEAAFNGGPLGELVQWSDLLSTLHILGHHVYLTASLPDLRHYFGVDTGGCPPLHSNLDLIYTDIIGLRQIKSVLKGPWFKYRCIIRVLDTFGTEPDFNHISWANKHKLESPFGGLNMIPLQFYTMFPHTPDNTFLGFVVQNQLMSEQSEQFKSNKRQNQALVYGKRAEFWEGKTAYLDVIHKYLEIHGTVNTNALPNYVKNHGIVKGTDVQALLRQSKVFVGLSFPYEGPAPLEALANGCAFLNPKLNPPQSSLNTKFFKGKPNIREIISQHPYAEAIGEPYVWTVDMKNLTEVERALNAILNQTIEPYLPYEFSCEGMLQRVNVLIEKQDLCSSAVSWPPLSALQVVKAQMSCKTACQKAGLICEPAFFPHLNNANTLAKNNVDCQTSEFSASGLVFPAYNSSQHCWFQSDPLLFSCVRSDESLTRVCPCRDFIKDQIALCKDCI
ncbi:alpha-1,6-mannosylglycoprotein 6-beta-N-acetylglucosaminyltransferase A-like [Pseudochaenichthys georgianus]|uniref:alpha-1,6-mannosylglycoprotein 6-beta-N-acetylglucosaminyltransferase A-like n=1 Tax=Pseudochaenichthys georgianus TaxID=52239 RepID=UPI0039C0EA1A